MADDGDNDNAEADEVGEFPSKLLQAQAAFVSTSLWSPSTGRPSVAGFRSQCLSVKTGVLVNAQ